MPLDKQFFKSLLGERCLDTAEIRSEYSHDETEDIQVLPDVVLFPESAEEISKILKYCNENSIPVTPSGAKTGLSGGAIPFQGGVALSTKRLNRIIQIDEDNFQVITEPGVITEVLQNAVKEKGLFYPPDPASKGSCFIGGNVSENSGGPKAVKYGVTNQYVLNLEVVLADGSIIWTGANVIKNATGYNLTQLITGSEGTLGIITKIVLKLIPHPTNDLLILVPFKDIDSACRAVNSILKAGITPSGLEFMEREALIWAGRHLGQSPIEIQEDDAAHLLIEVDGFNLDLLYEEIERINTVLEDFNIGEVLFADDTKTKEQLWKLRRTVGEAVKSNSIYKEEDTVVPRYCLPELMRVVKSIGNEYNFKSVCYGHAGDGNLHINIIKGDMTDDQWNNDLPNGIRKLFHEVVRMGGTISGEHGIGLVQKPYLDIAFDQVTINLMRSIKNQFDPNGILNPGKIF